MKRNEIFNSLKKYLESKSLEGDQSIATSSVNDNTVLSHIGFTSVEFVLLLVFIEDELGVTFEDDDLLMSNDITLGELVDRIMKFYN